MELIIANIVDAYRDNVALIQDPELRRWEVLDSYYIQDRALLWSGDRKVVVTSLPVEPAHVRHLQQVTGWLQIDNLYPQQPTDALCEDILREDALRAAIVDRCRDAGEVRLIPFIASAEVLEVAAALARDGLSVALPECPAADRLWVRDYLDSKAGFRKFFASIADRLDGVRLPEGAVAQDPAEAAEIVVSFLRRGRACLAKPNNSQSGVGFQFFRPGEWAGDAAQWQAAIQARLDGDSQMKSDVIVVEELIEMDRHLGGGSPSMLAKGTSQPASSSLA